MGEAVGGYPANANQTPGSPLSTSAARHTPFFKEMKIDGDYG